MKNVILASKSPRRKELLSRILKEFECIEAEIDEKSSGKTITPWIVAMENAEEKAKTVFEKFSDKIIISADTIVYSDKNILGKPKNAEEAFKMLRNLSGKAHEVYTGICIKSIKKIYIAYEVTSVNFVELTDDEIKNYIDSGEPMDKAGSYGIQGIGALFVKSISGDYYNVMGLPLCHLNGALKEFMD